jgi:hypothetical protein
MAKTDAITLTSKATEFSQPWLLEDIDVQAFGTPEEAIEKVKKTYTLRIGELPVVRSLRKLAELGGKQLPPEISALKGETYMITHAVGINAAEKPNSIQRISYRASFNDPGATTLELLPNTSFKEFFVGKLKFEASIAANGTAKTPELLSKLAEIINLGVGAELKVATEASMIGNLTLSLKSVKIQATGQMGATATWQFDRDENPLVGDQVLVQTIVVPKGQKKLTFSLQGFAIIDHGWFQRPVSIETPVTQVEVELDS